MLSARQANQILFPVSVMPALRHPQLLLHHAQLLLCENRRIINKNRNNHLHIYPHVNALSSSPCCIHVRHALTFLFLGAAGLASSQLASIYHHPSLAATPTAFFPSLRRPPPRRALLGMSSPPPCVIVLGPPGSGKCTLLNAVLGRGVFTPSPLPSSSSSTPATTYPALPPILTIAEPQTHVDARSGTPFTSLSVDLHDVFQAHEVCDKVCELLSRCGSSVRLVFVCDLSTQTAPLLDRGATLMRTLVSALSTVIPSADCTWFSVLFTKCPPAIHHLARQPHGRAFLSTFWGCANAHVDFLPFLREPQLSKWMQYDGAFILEQFFHFSPVISLSYRRDALRRALHAILPASHPEHIPTRHHRPARFPRRPRGRLLESDTKNTAYTSVIVVGSRGAGKSTLLRTLVGNAAFAARQRQAYGMDGGMRNAEWMRPHVDHEMRTVYFDTPGLDGRKGLPAVCKAISNAFRRSLGPTRLVFACTVDDGFVATRDVASVRLVLQALHRKGMCTRGGYSLVFSKVDNQESVFIERMNMMGRQALWFEQVAHILHFEGPIPYISFTDDCVLSGEIVLPHCLFVSYSSTATQNGVLPPSEMNRLKQFLQNAPGLKLPFDSEWLDFRDYVATDDRTSAWKESGGSASVSMESFVAQSDPGVMSSWRVPRLEMDWMRRSDTFLDHRDEC